MWVFHGEKSLGFDLVELESPPPYLPLFLRKLACQSAIEEEYIKKIYSEFKKGKTKIYLLLTPSVSEDIIRGLVALSVSRLDNAPAVLIDYIYIRPQDRKMDFEIGKGNFMKLSQLLVEFSIECALNVRKIVGVHLLILEPAHDKLIPFYKSLGFSQISKKSDWMYLKI